MAIGSYKLDSRWINGRQPSKTKGGGLKKKQKEKKRREKWKNDLHPKVSNGEKSRTKPIALERKRKYCTIKRNVQKRGKTLMKIKNLIADISENQ